jgi:hypothetical protein
MSQTPLPADHLQDIAFAVALEVAAHGETREVERRVVPAQPGDVAWSPVLLRQVYETPIAVYDPLGEIEVELDAQGKLWSLDDPRHAPAADAVHTSEQEAIEAVQALLGKPPIELEAELVRKGGKAHLRVKNRDASSKKGPAGGFESKFFQKKADEEDEKPKGPPPDRIDAEVNADTGAVYKLRRAPAPPPEEPAR